MKKLFLSIALTGILFFVGCGNGSGSGNNSLSSNSSSESNLESGTFSDSPVKNLYYETTSGITGFTDENGTFKYKEGDFITFKLGDLTLGTVKASLLVTPFSFSFNENKIAFIAYLLQNLDVDGNISNGIQLPDNEYISKVSLKDINLSDITSATKLSLIKTDLIKENSEYNFSDISLINAANNLTQSMKQNYILYMSNSKKSYILYNGSILLLENGNVYNEKNETIDNYQLDTNLSENKVLYLNNNSFTLSNIEQYNNLWFLNDKDNQQIIQSDNKKILELIKFSENQSFENINNETFYIMDSNFNKGVITFGIEGNVTININNKEIKGILDNGVIYLEQNNTIISAENSIFDVNNDVLLLTNYIIAPDLTSLNVLADKIKEALSNNQQIIPTTLQDILSGDLLNNLSDDNEGGIPVTISDYNQ